MDDIDPICANCGHTKSQHYHRKYSHSRGPGDACHALIWKRGQQKECGCNGFVEKIDGGARRRNY